MKMIKIDLPKLPPDTNMLYLVINKFAKSEAESYQINRQLQLTPFKPIPDQDAVKTMIQRGDMCIVQSDEAHAFKSLVLECLQRQNSPELINNFQSRPDDPVRVEIVCDLATSRQGRRELDNYMKCVVDALVNQCDLLSNDNCEKLIGIVIRNEQLHDGCKCRVYLAILPRDYCGSIGESRLDFGICETHYEPLEAPLAIDNDRIRIDLTELPPSLHKNHVYYGSNDDRIRIRFNFFKNEFMSCVKSCLAEQVSEKRVERFKSRLDARLKLTVICNMTEWYKKKRDLDNCVRSVCSALVECCLLKDDYSDQLCEITTRLPICADRFSETCKCRIILDFAC